MTGEISHNAVFKQQFKKRCFTFSLEIINLSKLLRKDRSNWILIDQLLRSATSIGANIVEGGSSSTRKEFINYFQIALKSSSETLYWLALMRESIPNHQEKVNQLIDECTEIKKIISTVILNTKLNSL